MAFSYAKPPVFQYQTFQMGNGTSSEAVKDVVHEDESFRAGMNQDLDYDLTAAEDGKASPGPLSSRSSVAYEVGMSGLRFISLSFRAQLCRYTPRIPGREALGNAVSPGRRAKL